MKKTLISTAVFSALLISGTAMANDTSTYLDNANSTNNTAKATGDAATANAKANLTNVGNNITTGSYNPGTSNSFNDTNSGNAVSIGEDGIVSYANQIDQSIARSDLIAKIEDTDVVVLGATSNDDVSGVGLITSTNANTSVVYKAGNTVAGSFSGASGVTVLSMNTGHVASIQQSTVVQTNMNLK
ncbi:MAG TPA: hypothetical protein ENJ32_07335 [Crenotrichaceae bacterium]|nr:hypothetical protein [Crenotrichaceae bacterium]